MIGDILQPTHLLFILVIALLVLGPKRLPEVGRSLGRGLRDFKSAIGGEDQDDDPVHDEVPVQATAAAQPVAASQAVAEPVVSMVDEPVSAPVTEPAASVVNESENEPATAVAAPVGEPAEHVG